MHGVARRVGGGMWVAAKFDCPTNRLEAWLAKETLRAAIYISLTRLRIQLENLYASSLHNLPDHNHQGLQWSQWQRTPCWCCCPRDVVKCYEPMNELRGRCWVHLSITWMREILTLEKSLNINTSTMWSHNEGCDAGSELVCPALVVRNREVGWKIVLRVRTFHHLRCTLEEHVRTSSYVRTRLRAVLSLCLP